MAKTQIPQPQSTQKWINPDGTPSLVFFQYMLSVNQLLLNNQFGPFVNAANDAAAAAAGVPINGLYRNGNAVQIRLV